MGPSICILCKQDVKTTTHLFVDCAYSKQLWRDMGQWISKRDI
jgi:hypothetical protein